MFGCTDTKALVLLPICTGRAREGPRSRCTNQWESLSLQGKAVPLCLPNPASPGMNKSRPLERKQSCPSATQSQEMGTEGPSSQSTIAEQWVSCHHPPLTFFFQSFLPDPILKLRKVIGFGGCSTKWVSTWGGCVSLSVTLCCSLRGVKG